MAHQPMSFDIIGRYTVHRSAEGVEIMSKPDLGGQPLRLVVPPEDAETMVALIRKYSRVTARPDS